MPLKSERLYEPQRGDRVRVVLEGEASDIFNKGDTDAEHFGFLHENGSGGPWVFPADSVVKSIEKIEPPVETFKPGDVVRMRGCAGTRVVLAENGYINEENQAFTRTRPWMEAEFTSKHYERVRLEEAPF